MRTRRLEVNHFADWTHEEYLAVMLPNHGRQRERAHANESLLSHQHVREVAPHLVPKTLDWRGTGADSPVKDQAMCGGCWVRALSLPTLAFEYLPVALYCVHVCMCACMDAEVC